MEYDDLLVREQLVEIFRDILRVPGIAAKAQDQGALR